RKAAIEQQHVDVIQRARANAHDDLGRVRDGIAIVVVEDLVAAAVLLEEGRLHVCPCRSWLMRPKNWSAIIFATPPSMRWPTPAMRPPTWTSALYVTRVPPSMSDSVMTVSPRTKPGPPLPSTAMRYDSGAFWSASRTLPSNVPLMAAMPIFITALNSSLPSA